MAHISADRVKDTTTSTGTGSLTLANSAPTGFRTLNAVASTNDTFFYCVELSSEWEVGLGTYSGSHVFARTTVLASSNSNAAVNFSAGTKNFFITIPGAKETSDAAYSSSWDGETWAPPSKNAVYDKIEGLIHPGYIAANWYTPLYTGAINNGAAAASGTIYYHPIYIPRAITVSDLGCAISTASAGGNVKLAIYAHSTSTNRPSGTPLAETGNISTTSTGLVSADITGANVTLAAGVYWAAFWMDNTSAILRCIDRTSMDLLSALIGSATQANVVNSSGFMLKGVTSAETFGTWPNATSETYTEVQENRAEFILMMKAA